MAGYSGDGSWQRLLEILTNDIHLNITVKNIYKENNSLVSISEIASQLPLDIIKSGQYGFNNGIPMDRNNVYGHFWTNRLKIYLRFLITQLFPHYLANQGSGFSVCRVAKSLN